MNIIILSLFIAIFMILAYLKCKNQTSKEYYCPIRERCEFPIRKPVIHAGFGYLPELFFYLDNNQYTWWDAPFHAFILTNFDLDKNEVDMIIDNGPRIRRKIDISYPYMIIVKNAYFGEDYKFFIKNKKLMIENNTGQYELEQYKHPLYA